MPKTIYTEQDIDEMKARGVTCVEVTENVVLTDLAVERANKYGLKINRASHTPPKATFSPSVNSYAAYARGSSSNVELKQKIKVMVLARLNGQVDEGVLEATIERVMRVRG